MMSLQLGKSSNKYLKRKESRDDNANTKFLHFQTPSHIDTHRLLSMKRKLHYYGDFLAVGHSSFINKFNRGPQRKKFITILQYNTPIPVQWEKIS